MGARLARGGFRDSAAASRHLELIGPVSEEVLSAVTSCADPDQALASLGRLSAAVTNSGELVAALDSDVVLCRRLMAVLGISRAWGDFLASHPTVWAQLAVNAEGDRAPHGLRVDLLTAVGADPNHPTPLAAPDDHTAEDSLRLAYHRHLLDITARDLTEGWQLEQTGAALADLAAATLEGALAVARAREPAAAACRLAVVAMGKTGGRELNYVSDVDVVFVHEPAEGVADDSALRAAGRVAGQLMRICSAHTVEGTIWQVDAALRPEGRSGPLVRTLSSHLAYYAKWARTWEFQALLKARPVAGDVELGQRYVQAVHPLVWQACERDGFVADVQAMRRRVVAQLPAGGGERELKLGAGGLRDVEFAVQLLQLVHGRADESLRSPTTLTALEALTSGGYIGRDDGAALAQAYRFLRTVEHRIQLFRLRRTHVMPDSHDDLRRLGRSLGYRADPAAELGVEWRRHRREVRRLHEKLFYRPLLEAVAALPADGIRLTAEEARARLTALGYADPRGALTHLEALTSGISRRAAIQRQLLPVMLGWFAEGPDPDAGLFAFRRLSESLGSTHWYLRQLRDESEAAQQVARVLSMSRFATGLLDGAPDAVAMFGADAELRPRSREQLVTEMTATVQRHPDPDDAARAVRAMRRRELCRIAVADVLGRVDVEGVGEALTDVTIATLSGALAAASASVAGAFGRPLPTSLAVVSMGRLGGHEIGYGSDADVMFVHVPHPDEDERDASDAASAVAQEMRRMLSSPGDDPPLPVDASLRPEGKQGPLVRSLASYSAYYARWSVVWEAQALLRAEAVVGDESVCAGFTELIDPLRWPAQGLTEADVTEIRRIKARVDAERLPRGADPNLHLKLGRGGLADVEWTVQLLQMRHGHSVAALRTTRTLAALEAAVRAGLLDPSDGRALARAWRLASRIRNAVTLVRGRPSDSFPRDQRDRAAVAWMLGYAPIEAERMSDDYRRATRRARAAVERSFYG